MDKEKTGKRTPFFQNAINSFRAEASRHRNEKGALISDIAVFLCAFFFSRKHLIFGTYPLGAALVAALPSRVWIALFGAVSGSVSMGRSGEIHAAVVLLTVFLRIIISYGSHGREENSSVFSEPPIMRISAVSIAAFVGAGYEMLFSSFSFSSILFGVFGVGLTIFFAFAFLGLFFVEISPAELLGGQKTLFRKKDSPDRMGLIFFQASLLLILFLISVSLAEYVYFGISVAYIFSVSVTLFVSKRFGAVRGMAVGFVTSAGLNALYSPAFALVGALSSLLYPFGIGYALIGAGVAFSAWGGYAGGVGGLLSLFPEYLISAILISSALRRTPTEREEEVSLSLCKESEEMVVAAWLSERANVESLSSLEEALRLASERIGDLSRFDTEPDFEEYKRICEKHILCEKTEEYQENINKTATKLYKNHRISPVDLEAMFKIQNAEEISLLLLKEAAAYERGLYERRKVSAAYEDYFLISKMIGECRLSESSDSAINERLTLLLSETFVKFGFPEGSVKVFGEDKIRIIGAGEDPDGRLITSPDLKVAMEEALGYRLGRYEYFRRGEMALFKCSAVASLAVDYGSAKGEGSASEPSGDSARFLSLDDSFFSIISDGMGRGREARECADFVTSYLTDLFHSDVGIDSAASALSHILRQRDGECTATLDLFKLDLIRGEALFVKSGAAPSYVKRGKSIFRIRSETAPIGLMRSLDAEKIRVEVKEGDAVIMLSDGVSASVEDSAWLLSFLAREEVYGVEEYAKRILDLAAKKNRIRDDMTVSVIKITSA